MSITTALKISMCIPFNAVKFNNIYVDGGLMDPLPSTYINEFNEKVEINTNSESKNEDENEKKNKN